MESKLAEMWNKHDRLDGKVYMRRKIRVAGPCTYCTGELPPGALFWRRGHIRYHIECFEALQQAAREAAVKGVHAGRKPVLDVDKERMIDDLLHAAAEARQIPNISEIALKVNISPRTVSRYIRGQISAVRLK